MSEEREFKVGIYRHFKGGMYRTYELATDSERGETMVVYRSMQNNRLYVRPFWMFMSEVDREKYPDAKQKERFKLLYYCETTNDIREDKYPLEFFKTLRESMFKAGAKEALEWFLEKYCGEIEQLQWLAYTNEAHENLEKHIDERLDEWSKDHPI